MLERDCGPKASIPTLLRLEKDEAIRQGSALAGWSQSAVILPIVCATACLTRDEKERIDEAFFTYLITQLPVFFCLF